MDNTQNINEAIREILINEAIPRVKNMKIDETKIVDVDFPYDDLDTKEFELFCKKHNITDATDYMLTAKYGDCIVYATFRVSVDLTEKEKIKIKRERASGLAYRPMYDNMIAKGFKRVGFNSGLLRQFDDTSIYDMIMNDDIDRLVSYYRMYFAEA